MMSVPAGVRCLLGLGSVSREEMLSTTLYRLRAALHDDFRMSMQMLPVGSDTFI